MGSQLQMIVFQLVFVMMLTLPGCGGIQHLSYLRNEFLGLLLFPLMPTMVEKDSSGVKRKTMSLPVITISGSMTVDYGAIYFVDATNGAINLTLPITTGNEGGTVQFRRIDWISSNTVTITTNAGDGSMIDENTPSLTLSPVHVIGLTVDGTNSWIQLHPNVQQSGMFGDGSDGDLVLSTNQTLASDMNFRSLTVKGGAVVNLNGYRVSVSDRLTLQGTGTLIHNNGTAAVNGTAGAGGGSNSVGGGFAGAAGVTAGAGTPGIQGNPTSATPGSLGGAGGAGGASGGGNAGGAGGTNTRPTVAAGGANCIRKWQHAIVARDHNSAILIGGSSGGSGGCAAGASGTSGGGGGSGGIVVLAARSVVCTAAQSVTISANGGAGGAATGTGNAGGGGGGGGGCVIIVTRTPAAQSSCPGLSLTVNGGAGGAAVGTGSSGTAGVNGIIRIVDSI